MRVSDPIVVSYSAPGESRWGYHQFPALSRLPDRSILLMYADAEDASESHGAAAPAFVSTDGEEWASFTGEPTPIRPHFAISEMDDGEFLIVPAERYFDAAGLQLPEPVATADVYGTVYTYRCSELPGEVGADLGLLPALRYAPDTRSWSATTVSYDMTDRLAWRREGSSLLPRPFFERSVTKHGDAYLYPDYRVRFALPDGRIAPKGCTWLMASTDNGRTFTRRGLVAVDPSGHDLCGEPTVAETSDDKLVCVVRRTDHVQKPMAITWSHNDGRSWSPLLDLFDFGVFPSLLSLANGTLLLSYGRPGVYLAVSRDGTGRRWDETLSIIEGDHSAVQRDSCGYTNMLAMSDSTALIAYSDFQAKDRKGRRCKAVCVRLIET